MVERSPLPGAALPSVRASLTLRQRSLGGIVVIHTTKIIELPGRSSAERDDWKEDAAGRQRRATSHILYFST
jgi:hypothetical protein